LADAWILEKMRYLIREVTADLNNYRFSQAGEKLREFTWESLADWYLEISKFEKNQTKNQIFSLLLRDLLKLWHPFIPFVTEVIWSELSGKEMLIISRWPDVNQYNEILDNLYNAPHFVDFELKTDSIIEIIKAIRNARAENKIEPAKKIKAVIYAKDKTVLVESQANLIKNLRTGISDLEIKEAGEKIVGAIYIAMSEIEIYLIGAIDIEKEKVRLMKEKENLEKMIAGLKAKLDNQEFIAKAPGAIVNKDKEKLANCKKELIKLKNQLNELK
jgi:valyl-tRNA synthetase